MALSLSLFKTMHKGRPLAFRRTAYLVAFLCLSYVFWPTKEDADHLIMGNTVFPAAKPGYKPVDLSAILMHASELKLVHKYLAPASGVPVKNYLEWGSGGSTFNFPQYVSGRYVSIEHDQQWCDKVKRETMSDKKVEVRCVSVPRGTGGWGLKSPFEEGTYPVFKAYIDEITKVSKQYNNIKWDFILIDGRDRVDAAIKALSHISSHSIVALHDSWRTRWKYGQVYDFYDVVDESISFWSQGVVIMKRKKQFHHLEDRPDLTQKILDKKYNL